MARNERGQFLPGHPGGPGRPKGSRGLDEDVRKLAREYGPGAVRVLAEIMEKGRSERARVQAASLLLAHGIGQPSQSHQLSVQRISSIGDLSHEEMEAIATELEATYGREALTAE